MDVTRPAVIAIVGAGPRGTGLLERIGANVPELFGGRALEIHVIDPFPPGAGRVWRYHQSPLLKMNSMAEDVTMFTDHSVQCEGPIRPGPSLSEWADQVRGLDHGELTEQLRRLEGTTFPTRQLQSQYLSWVFRRVLADLPPEVSVHVHATRATGVTGGPSDRQRVWLEGRPAPLLADVVILALGHLDAEPTGEHEELRRFAQTHGLCYLPPAYTADADLTGIKPGENVIVRGFGLAFIDLMVLLTEGRGGGYRRGADNRLVYVPSGTEPRLYVGSRRGVPYHAKPAYRLRGSPPQLPRFFDTAAVDLASGEPLDFRRDVWPLVAKEIAWGYYQELFTGHPERVASSWPEFASRYSRLDWDDERMSALIERSVPDPEDRIDFERLDRPLRGLRFATFEDLQHHLRRYIEADVARRSDPAHSADLGAFMALLSVFGQLHRLMTLGKMAPRSQVEDVDGWWFGFFNYFASGPPGPRLEQLLALSRAGVVQFLGADMWVEPSREHGVFRAGSASTDTIVEATALVEARLPAPSVRRSRDALLRGLYLTGEGSEEILVDGGFVHNTGLLRVGADGRILDRHDRPHPRRFAVGPYTTNRSGAGFARPGTNAPAFRQNDAIARAVLRFLRETAGAAGPPTAAWTARGG
ncbi:hypothetical protein LI90_3179 [Carbonactinospora thermoautotrophica]|uniref:FAD-dependent urate hydroxylase HpyO/Asp monooxygenase CreE-like FAD/NAD(P)-binding domain-containing protein n=1 Tax=Carbonactinospora thermoautotrophica TaxID=1469144 RepID=A0A132MW50_9ACTN|nr:FAD/NAD(P)-binding protein [Carbonactinospora thermoautotrophica]KWX02138.1 hypothetical protein LI90_3179 [Carbonactinospora thermoautotrophica]